MISVKLWILISISTFGSKLERLAFILGRNKSTSEHLLSNRSSHVRKMQDEKRSAWARTKNDLSQDLRVACRIYVVYSELGFRAVGVPRRCLDRNMFG